MSSERIVGYVLISLGIMTMVFAAIQIITVYTNKATPIEFFTSKPIIAQQVESDGTDNMLAGLGGGSSLPIPQLIDPALLNNVLNMAIYFLIMNFLLGLGFKIANLGVQLVRPIKVEVRNNQIASILEKKPTSPGTNPA